MSNVLTDLNALLDEDISMWRDLEAHRRVRAAAAALEQSQERLSWVDMSPGLKCPSCDDTGGFPVDDGHGGCEEQQCEFCWVVDDSIFNKSRKALALVKDAAGDRARYR